VARSSARLPPLDGPRMTRWTIAPGTATATRDGRSPLTWRTVRRERRPRPAAASSARLGAVQGEPMRNTEAREIPPLPAARLRRAGTGRLPADQRLDGRVARQRVCASTALRPSAALPTPRPPSRSPAPARPRGCRGARAPVGSSSATRSSRRGPTSLTGPPFPRRSSHRARCASPTLDPLDAAAFDAEVASPQAEHRPGHRSGDRRLTASDPSGPARCTPRGLTARPADAGRRTRPGDDHRRVRPSVGR
jgi:hypothetical protein